MPPALSTLLSTRRFAAALAELRRSAPDAPDWYERTRLELRLTGELLGARAARDRGEQRVRDAAGRSPAVRAGTRLDLAMEIRIGDPARAWSLIEEARALEREAPSPGLDHRIQLASTCVLFAMGDSTGAERAVRQLERSPDDPDLDFDTCYAHALVYRAEHPAALPWRERAVAVAADPLERARAIHLLANDLLDLRGPSEALERALPELDLLAGADSEPVAARLLRTTAGIAHLLLGDRERSEAQLRRAAAPDPSWPLPWFQLAILHALADEPDAARDALGRLGPSPVFQASADGIEAAMAVARRDGATCDQRWRDFLARGSPRGTTFDRLLEVAARQAERLPGKGWVDRAVELRRFAVLWSTPDVRERSRVALRRLASKGGVPRLGRFRLEARVGRGAFATVWRAQAPSGLPVAVKVLSDREPHHARMLRRELQVVAGLDHPRVIRVLDHGVVDGAAAAMEPALLEGAAWIAMPLVAGGTLETRLGVGSWEHAQRDLLALLDALAHAHARGVLHLDVKPANVLVGEDGPCVADFGLATVRGQPARSGSAGTPAYAAPEVFRGRPRELGPWTDLYSVGCVAVALTCGAPPFSGTTLAELRAAHLSDAPEIAPRIGVPDGFHTWVRRLLAKEPADRYRSAAAAAHDLSALGAPVAREVPDLRPIDPGELPTVVLPEPEGPLPARGRPLCAPSAPLAVPERWSRGARARTPPALVDAGLGLFGLRVPPFVGRAQARAALWGLLREARERGVSRVAALAAAPGEPPGIGLSALSAWFGERAAEVGAATVLVADGAPDDLPGAAVLRALRATWRCEDLAGAELALHLDRTATADGLRDAEQLAALLDAGSADPEELAGVLAALAGRRPVILRVERAREDALVDRVLARRAPIVVVGAWAGVEPIRVGRLSDAEQGELVDGLLPLSPGLAREVAALAAGHPRVVVQLLTELVSRGLVAGDDGYRSRSPLPASIEALWDLRVETLRSLLPASARRALGRVADRVVVSESALQEACEAEGADAESLRERLIGTRLAAPHPVGFAFVDGEVRARLS